MNLRPVFLSACLVLFQGCATSLPSDPNEFAFTLDAPWLYRQAVTRDVRLSDNGRYLELERGELIEDDGPASGYSYKPNLEKISGNLWIRKELLVTRPQADRATLLVAPGGKLNARINGKPCPLERKEGIGNYWQIYSFDPALLREGKNEIVLYGDGQVWIARDDEYAAGAEPGRVPPNRSARSTDGGKTWDDRHLGVKGDVDGEYGVRLFLDQYRPEGRILMPVLDLGNPENLPVAPSVAAVGPVQITARHSLALQKTDREGEVPPSPASGDSGGSAASTTAVSFDLDSLKIRVRSGTTAVVDGQNWTNWKPLNPNGILSKPAGRYLQVELIFTAEDLLRTPQLENVAIRAEVDYGEDWTDRIRVVQHRNENIIRSSLPFVYEPFDHPKLKTLREQYKLDEVVAGAESELDLIARLALWTSQRDGIGIQGVYPPWDALEIMKRDGMYPGAQGFCQIYNLLFLQACESFGLCGRAVSLGPGTLRDKIRSGHEVTEIWSNQYGKWIYVDGQAAWYAVDEKTGAPLSLLELRNRQMALVGGQVPPGTRIVLLGDGTNRRWQWSGLDSWPAFGELRIIPRSNFLEEKAPLPLNQGMRGWFWTGHYFWDDGIQPARYQYRHRVTKRDNFEWTLNQTHIVLEADRAAGVLHVHLDTETPGFKTFMAEIDGGQAMPVQSSFPWTLHEGRNTLRVYTVNNAGRKGIESSMQMEYGK